ncbi:MAG: BatD family protein [Candidatus Omnitrophota bacterium]
MKAKIIILLTICLMSFGIICGNAYADDLRLGASLERNTVSIGNPVYLYLSFIGAQNIAAPDISETDGLKITYVGPSTKMSIVNGQTSLSITHTYLIIARKEGTFYLGPFFADHKGQKYTSNRVALTVQSVPSQQNRGSTSNTASQSPASGAMTRGQSEAYLRDNVFLELSVPKRVVYINEVLPVSTLLYVGQIKVQNIEYPSFQHEGFSAGDLEQPRRIGRMVNGMSYDVLSFKQDLFAIKEGVYQLGPARLNCKILERRDNSRRSSSRFSFDDFFGNNSGYTSYPAEVSSESLSIKILPFPEEGKPSDFRGAVGNFNMSAYVKPPKVKVGDPIVLTMIITGDGNFDTVTSPVIDIMDDFKTYEPEVKREGNKKIYEQILIPKDPKVKEVPAVSFSFLNPSTGRYDTVRKGPFAVSISERPESEQGVKIVSMADGMGISLYPREELGRDIVYIKENIGDLKRGEEELYRNKLFLFGQILPLIMLGIFYSGYKRKERMLTDKKYARFMKAPKAARKGLEKAKTHLDKGEMLLFYDTVFKTIQEYLSHKFNIAIGNITPQSAEEKLRKAGCDESLIEMLHEIFSACEMARYASSKEEGDRPQTIFSTVKKVIDGIERTRV